MTDVWIHEKFDEPEIDLRLHWLNPPSEWRVDQKSSCLVIQPDANTDFWRKTHYEVEADNGHFLFSDVPGDMILTTTVRFHAVHPRDQAGLMVRLSPDCWLKASAENEPGEPVQVTAVVTNHGYSDWSSRAVAGDRTKLSFRIRREGKDFAVEYSEKGLREWALIRIAHLHVEGTGGAAKCGLYSCSPSGAGLRAEFEFLKIELGRLRRDKAR
jgi:regulation of enolase protein 1 (concanavalin A-like superfamily)